MPIGVGQVDCVENSKLCQEQKIAAFPTIRWFQEAKGVLDAVLAFTRHTSHPSSAHLPRFTVVQAVLQRQHRHKQTHTYMIHICTLMVLTESHPNRKEQEAQEALKSRKH